MKNHKDMTILAEWLTEETGCWAQDTSTKNAPAIYIDGTLSPKDIKELAKRVRVWEEL